MKGLVVAVALASAVSVASAQTDLTVVGFVPPAFAKIARGSIAAIDVTVRNLGSAPATNVRLDISLPPSTTFNGFNIQSVPCSAPAAGSSGAISCTYASLASGAATGFRLFYNVPATYPIDADATVTAAVTSDTPDPNPGNNSFAVSTLVRGRADLAGAMQAAADHVQPLDQMTFTFSVTNLGPDPSRDVDAQFTFSGTTTVLEMSSPSGTCSLRDQECQLGDLAPGAHSIVTIVANAPGVEQVWSCSGFAASNLDVDPKIETAATARVNVSQPGVSDVSVEVAVPSALAPNTDAAITLKIHNAGPDAARLSSFTISAPAGVTLVSLRQTSGPEFLCGTTSGCGTLTPLDPGAQADFTLVANFAPSAIGRPLTVSASSVTADPNLANNTVTVPLGTPARRRAVHR